jgi:putative FmdB family regulatory protein
MPLYEYECDACGHRFEKIQKFSDPLVDICPTCGGAVHKLMSSPAIQFKGSGFYITDYPKGDKGSAPKSDGGKSDQAGKAESSDASASGKSEKSEKADKTEKSGTSEKGEKSEKSAKADAPAKADKSSSSTESSSGASKPSTTSPTKGS